MISSSLVDEMQNTVTQTPSQVPIPIDKKEKDDLPTAEGIADIEIEAPYTVFTGHQKAFIVTIASLAAFFSPLSANIYYPVLTVLADDLQVSDSLINLTVTSYLIFQGLAPAFVGSISDETGRRPSYIVCFVIYLGANVGLALQGNYAALFVLRCLQSAGSSGTVALANAVVSDVATSAERGSYIGYASMGALLGPAVGPIIGGLLAHFLDWRAIFWFLVILSGVTLAIILLFLPETCRNIVGNGSTQSQRWNVSFLTFISQRKDNHKALDNGERTAQRSSPRRSPNPFNTIRIMRDPECGIVLLYCGLLFAGFYMILTSMPSLFQAKYGFNTIQVALCFIPTGCGSFFAAVFTGRVTDWNFRRHAKLIGSEIVRGKQQDQTNFPIEEARLQIVLPMATMSGLLVIAYGWVMYFQTSLAGPLILLFLIAFGVSGSFQLLSTLIVDLNRDSPGTATAAMNLARCWLGAAATAIVIPLQGATGIGWVGVIVGALWLLMSPVSILVIKRGPTWRKERTAKEKAKKDRIEAKRRSTTELEEGKSG